MQVPYSGYIHTFSKKEQNRLLKQARFLEPYFYPKIDLTGRQVLEIGCGVGAQIALLSKKFPDLLIDGVDWKESQIQRATQVLAAEIATQRISLAVASAYQLPFPDDFYDGVCIFCVLEHTHDPIAVFNETSRVLKPKGIFYCTEVFNSGLYIYPRCPAILSYWDAFNRCQIDMGGDPDIGIKLVNFALQVGFKDISFYDVSAMLDGRISQREERKRFLNFWKTLFLRVCSQ